MSAILDEPAIRRAALPVSVQFYHELGRLGMLDRNVELLDGVIVSKMSKSPLHAAVARRLARLIAAVLKDGQYLLREDPLTLETSEPEPDLAVVEGQEGDFFDHHPRTALLVVEVAISSVEIDRRKAALYAHAGVGEYWLVEPETRRITVFRQSSAEGYAWEKGFTSENTLACEVLPALELNVGDLFPS